MTISNEIRGRIKSMYVQGATAAQVAAEFDVSDTTVRNIVGKSVRKPGVIPVDKRRVVAMCRNGMTYNEIAAALGVTKWTVYKHIEDLDVRPRRPVLSFERTKRNLEIIESYIDGESKRSIARRHGITPQRVHSIIERSKKRAKDL